MKIGVGDYVRPKPEWIGDPNQVPTGLVTHVAPWGRGVAVYVGDELRAFADYVFEVLDRLPPGQVRGSDPPRPALGPEPDAHSGRRTERSG